MTSSSGLRRTYLTILESAGHAFFKMVRYVLLRPLRPEVDVIQNNCRVRFVGISRYVHFRAPQLAIYRWLQEKKPDGRIQDATLYIFDKSDLAYLLCDSLFSQTTPTLRSEASPLLYATLRYSTLLYATLRYSTLLYSILPYSTLLYSNLFISI
jgi:hypothetical protein